MEILLIISGSIASYKSLNFIREVNKRKFNVTSVITKAGEKFVTPLSAATLSGNYAYTDSNFFSFESNILHIHLSRKSDVVLVLPATADIIAKFANGIADELATTILLTATVPIIMVPAMNTSMWQAKSTQRNVQLLREYGVEIIDPNEGSLACGEYGVGQMEENIDKILERIHLSIRKNVSSD